MNKTQFREREREMAENADLKNGTLREMSLAWKTCKQILDLQKNVSLVMNA